MHQYSRVLIGFFIDVFCRKMSNAGRGCLSSEKEREGEEFTVYVRKEGRITLPKEVRDALAIVEGCLVRCKVIKVKSRK